MDKEYKPIPIRPRYLVSKCGTSIRCTVSGRELKMQENIVKGKVSGYVYASLPDPVYKTIRTGVHRLVCMAFHGMPPKDKPWVNHKDGNKRNNAASNLEWTSISQNIQHAVDSGLRVTPKGKDHWLHGREVSRSTRDKMSKSKQGIKHPKFKGFYVIDGVQYPSATQAAKMLGVSTRTVLRRCKKKPNKHYNFYFLPASQ